jgi:Peptidase C39 family
MTLTQERKQRVPGWVPFLLACTQVLAQVGVPVNGDDPRSDAETKKIWRTGQCCGINSLYLALRLQAPDNEISYEAIEKRLPQDRPGNSMTEMCQCAESFGVKAKVLKLTPETLTQDRLPAIAHFEEEKGKLGHFVVVTAVGEDGVEYIDGTSAILQVVPMSYFRQEWDGYTIVFAKRQHLQPLYVVAILLGALSLGVTLWNWRRYLAGVRTIATGCDRV